MSSGVRPVVKIKNKEGWFVKFEPQESLYVQPKVEGNTIKWRLPNGILAQYTALRGKIKADYIISKKSQLISNQLNFIVRTQLLG